MLLSQTVQEADPFVRRYRRGAAVDPKYSTAPVTIYCKGFGVTARVAGMPLIILLIVLIILFGGGGYYMGPGLGYYGGGGLTLVLVLVLVYLLLNRGRGRV